MNIDTQLMQFKTEIETAIRQEGSKGKESLIRSSVLINYIHDAVKNEFIQLGIDEELIYPHLYATKPELKLAGFLKQKDQDICITPRNIAKKKTKIVWGPLASVNPPKYDEYGSEFSTQTLVINVRSQISSIKKNTDTLFERTFAEALNLHMKYPEIVLGEVYLIPLYEYDEDSVKQKKVAFSNAKTDIEKYISFFSSINQRRLSEIDKRGDLVEGKYYAYERCALLIVDFNRDIPKLYQSTEELKTDELISRDSPLNLDELSFSSFAKDILQVYASRFDINNLRSKRPH